MVIFKVQISVLICVATFQTWLMGFVTWLTTFPTWLMGFVTWLTTFPTWLTSFNNVIYHVKDVGNPVLNVVSHVIRHFERNKVEVSNFIRINKVDAIALPRSSQPCLLAMLKKPSEWNTHSEGVFIKAWLLL
jgi:hypothetical protein